MLAFIVRLKARAILLVAFAALLTTGAAAAGSAPHPASGTGRPSGTHQVFVAPRGAHPQLAAAPAVSAAQTCAAHATAAGWANNGALVIASAVCVGESGGRQAAYFCDVTGQDGEYPPVTCPGIYDRGLWQLDSAGQSGTPDSCAFDAQCNADAAYMVSMRGTDFAPWSVYTSGDYFGYVSAAQEAVNGLRSGTVTSGVLGVCLARVRYAQNAPVVIGRCGTGVRQQQWNVQGATIRAGQICVAIASDAAYAHVWLRWCDGLTWQKWTYSGTGQLRNARSGECLRDPGGIPVPGTQVTVAPCAASLTGMWWLP